MKSLLEKCSVLGKSEIEASRKMTGGQAFTGIVKKHESDKSLFSLVISQKGQVLTVLEFPQDKVVDYQVENEGEGKVTVWVAEGTEYIQKSYLVAGKGQVAAVPGITPVFGGQWTGEPVSRCSCDCECSCSENYPWSKNAAGDDTESYKYHNKYTPKK